MALRVIPPRGSRPTGHGDWVGAGQVHTRSLGQPLSPWERGVRLDRSCEHAPVSGSPSLFRVC